jgi:hypothetical protein
MNPCLPKASAIGDDFVFSEEPAAVELEAGTAGVIVAALGYSFSWTTDELACALYDAYGRLIEIVRITVRDHDVVHNHPRAPSVCSDFCGRTGRINIGGDQAIGRNSSSTDTNPGTAFWPIFNRNMGRDNTAATAAGDGDLLDARLNEGAVGEELEVILTAGPSYPVHQYSIVLSMFHRPSAASSAFLLGMRRVLRPLRHGTASVATTGSRVRGGNRDALDRERFSESGALPEPPTDVLWRSPQHGRSGELPRRGRCSEFLG